jgi:hypothetical protein
VAELNLEPYTARLHWRLPDPANSLDWNRLLSEYLEALAARCEVDGRSVIGHIKGLATFGDGAFVRANVVTASRPADVAGSVPSGCRDFVFTMNVLVYGLSYADIAAHVTAVAQLVGARWDVAITVRPVIDDHESHHHDWN